MIFELFVDVRLCLSYSFYIVGKEITVIKVIYGGAEENVRGYIKLYGNGNIYLQDFEIAGGNCEIDIVSYRHYDQYSLKLPFAGDIFILQSDLWNLYEAT